MKSKRGKPSGSQEHASWWSNVAAAVTQVQVREWCVNMTCRLQRVAYSRTKPNSLFSIMGQPQLYK
mgnify:CR=1 FL=1